MEYINAFASPQVEQGKIRYCTEVQNIAECKADASFPASCRYKLTLSQSCEPTRDGAKLRCSKKTPSTANGKCRVAAHRSTTTQIMGCEVLVMANGMWQPRIVRDWFKHMQSHTLRYDELSGIPLEAFEDKSVLILG